MQYTMSLLYYGAHQIYVNKRTLENMRRSLDYIKYKALVIRQLKKTLDLPKKGKVEPIMKLLYQFEP